MIGAPEPHAASIVQAELHAAAMAEHHGTLTTTPCDDGIHACYPEGHHGLYRVFLAGEAPDDSLERGTTGNVTGSRALQDAVTPARISRILTVNRRSKRSVNAGQMRPISPRHASVAPLSVQGDHPALPHAVFVKEPSCLFAHRTRAPIATTCSLTNADGRP